jgi:hypothetical protein
MKLLRVFLFSLCATLLIFWPPHASAQSRGADACAFLAGKITPGISGQVAPDPRFSVLQQLRDRIYFKCLQSHRQQTAPGANAAAKAGTFTTKAGTFITFDAPGAVNGTQPTSINLAG